MLSQFNEIKQSKYHQLMAFLKNVDYEWKEQEKNTKATKTPGRKMVQDSYPLDKKSMQIGHDFKQVILNEKYLK